MATNNFYDAVRIELIKRRMKLRELYAELEIQFSYNYYYQVLKGFRVNPELLEKTKNHLNIK